MVSKIYELFNTDIKPLAYTQKYNIGKSKAEVSIRPGHPAHTGPLPLRAMAQVHPHSASEGSSAAQIEGAAPDQPVHPNT